MKKNDWIMIAVVIIIASAFFGFHLVKNEKGSGIVEVQVKGEYYGKYSLEEEQRIEINETNQIEIADGTAKVIWANCPDQVCVNHKAISREGESIICLPNQVVISIVDGEKSELDALAD